MIRTPLIRRSGGSAGNEQLTAVLGAILIVLLLVEGATLLQLRSLLNVHAFVGMLLIPIIALKIGSTSWRMARYYLRRDEYVRRGPPHIALRALVGPVSCSRRSSCSAPGSRLLVRGETQGTIVGLHKASFVVWAGAFGIHVLAHVLKLPRASSRRGISPESRFAFLLVGRRCLLFADRGARRDDAARSEQLQDRATSPRLGCRH